MPDTVIEPIVIIETDEVPEADFSHVVCECDLDMALCGYDLTGHAPVFDLDLEAELCLVCKDLLDYPCPHCGGRFEV